MIAATALDPRTWTLRHRIVAFGASLLTALLVVVGTASPASAHAALLSTTPGDSETLQVSPAEVTLTFGEPVGLALGNVQVVSDNGDRVDVGSPRRTDGGTVVHAALRSDLPKGSYVVIWRVISADAHPVSGAFTFSVGAPSKPAAELLGRGNISDLAPQPPAPGVALGVSRFVGFAGLMLLLGGSLFCLFLWPAGVASLRMPLRVGAGAVLISAVSGLLLQGPYASGNDLDRVTDGALLAAVLPTQYGIATVARAMFALLALVLLVRVRGRRGAALIALAGIGAAAGSTAAGHAGVGVWQPFTAIFDLTHLIAVAAWTGGLVVLGLGLKGRWNESEQATLLPAWSRLATWSVVALVLTGTFSSVREVGALAALETTTYGRILLVKVLIVGLMLAFGLIGRSYLRDHYGRGATDADGMTSTTVATLRRSAAFETGLAIVVLGLTAVLVNTTPAKAAFAPPYLGQSTAGPITVALDIYPAKKGRNGVHIYTTRQGGKTVDVEEVTGYVEDANGERVILKPRRGSLGHYEDLTFILPSKGTWKMVLQIRVSDIDSYSTTQTFEAR